MRFSTINKLCFKIIVYYKQKQNGIYNYQFEHEIKEYIEVVDKIIDKKLLNYILSKNKLKEYYYILYYTIINHEELIDEKERFILELLKNSNNKIDPSFDILIMNSDLNDIIIDNILENIDNKKDQNLDLGIKPFDYRYHILKRKEISDDIKENILNTYDIDELNEVLNDINSDLGDEIESKNIMVIDDIYKYKDLEDECRAFTILNERKNKRKMNKIK